MKASDIFGHTAETMYMLNKSCTLLMFYKKEHKVFIFVRPHTLTSRILLMRGEYVKQVFLWAEAVECEENVFACTSVKI